jgi:hypothetical protein
MRSAGGLRSRALHPIAVDPGPGKLIAILRLGEAKGIPHLPSQFAMEIHPTLMRVPREPGHEGGIVEVVRPFRAILHGKAAVHPLQPAEPLQGGVDVMAKGWA